MNEHRLGKRNSRPWNSHPIYCTASLLGVLSYSDSHGASRNPLVVFHPACLLPPVFGPSRRTIVEQKFDGTPKAELRLKGRKVTRSAVANDWGLMLRWVVMRDGKVVATAPARADDWYELPAPAPGTYTVVLQSWKYMNYAKTPAGEFTASRFVDISSILTYTV